MVEAEADILLVIALAGIFGGLTGHMARQADLPAKPKSDVATARPVPNSSSRRQLFTDVLLGLVAAFCVPIFLAVAQSKLLDNLDKLSFPQILYLSGYCLIASFSSRAFLEGISGQVLRQTRADNEKLKEGQKALEDEVADLAEEKAARPAATAEEPTDQSPPQGRDDKAGGASLPQMPRERLKTSDEVAQEPRVSELIVTAPLSQIDQKVLKALNSNEYVRRSLSGVARDTGISKPETHLVLARLEDAGLVAHGSSTRTGSLMYQLTAEGRRIVCK